MSLVITRHIFLRADDDRRVHSRAQPGGETMRDSKLRGPFVVKLIVGIAARSVRYLLDWHEKEILFPTCDSESRADPVVLHTGFPLDDHDPRDATLATLDTQVFGIEFG